MKKTILAAVIPTLFIANAACAGIKLVETDDITVDLNGDIDLKIINKNSNDDGTTIETNFDDLDFTFTYQIDEKLKFIAETDFTMESEDGDGLENAGAWLGFETDYGLLRAGYQAISFDPLGIDSSELTSVGMSSGDTDATGTEHENSVVYEYETDTLWISATYGKEGDTDEDTAKNTNPEIMQIASIVNIGDLELGAGYGKTQRTINDTEIADKSTYYQAQAEYSFGDLKMGVLYGHQDEEINDIVTQGYEFDISYKVNSNITVMAGAERISQDIASESNNDDLDLAYLGATYKFNKYVKLYAEVGKKDGDFASYGSSSSSDKDEEMVGLMLGVDF